MHLLTTMRSGSLRALPDRLPPALHEAAAAAARRPQAATSRAIPPQFTGQFPAPGAQRPSSPLAAPPRFATPPVAAQTTGSDWLVTAQDKVRFDQEFARLDTRRVGYIDGEQAVGFFSRSGLSEDTLASIWDLADIRSEGQLNKDEFAVAMYLIRQQRSKTTGRDDLPSALPPQLVPPSMRQKVIPPSQTTAPAFDNAANAPQQQSKSAADDLFGLDAFSSDAPAQASPKQVPTSPNVSAQAPPMQAQQTGFGNFAPFQPTSSFGRSLGQSSVGGGSQTNLAQTREMPQQQQASASDDLLGGDVEPDVSSTLNNDTAELGNMSNQLGTLRTQMSEVQGKRSVAENDVSTTANQKRELETRLTQFRGQYEQEIREVKAIEERLKVSRAETQQLQSQIAMIEGAHTDLQTKHREVTAALDADQRENSALKERTQALNAEITQLKPQLEKMQVDARQQKGLVAINKKQLAASEAERQRIEREMVEAEQERNRLQQEAEASTEALRQDALRQEASRQEAARQESLRQEASRQEASRQETTRQESLRQEASRQASPAVSPPMSSGSNTNPFFRRTTSGSVDRVMSPSIFNTSTSGNTGHDAFDSFFGPSETTTQPIQPPPATSFRSVTPLNQINSPATEAGSRSIEPFETSPQSSEPPAPAQVNQITSSALPLRMKKSDDSISSSVMPNPPLSRSGDSSREIPTQTADTPTDSLNGDTERSAPASFAERSAIDADPPTSAPTDRELTPTSTQAPESSRTESVRSSQPPTDTVPGAFPGGSSAGTTPTTEQSEAAASSDLTAAARGAEPSGASTSAFSPFSGQMPAQGNSKSEFPPIQNLDDDDDSDDSASEEGYADDDHTPSSTTAATRDVTGATNTSGGASAIATAPIGTTTDTLPVPQAKAAEIPSANASQLPTPMAEQSPPTYNQRMPDMAANGEGRIPNQYPQEYGDLLPSREITQSPPTEVPQSPPADLNAMSNPASRHASAAAFEPSPTIAPAAATQTSKPAPVDEFDDAFDDLSEAKADDTDAFGSSTRSDYEFNPNFDSPAPSHATMNDTPRHQPTSSFDSAFGGSGAQPFTTAATSSTQQQTSNSNHDWDELFSGLDSSTTATNGSRDPFEIVPGGMSSPGSGEIMDGPAPGYGGSSHTTATGSTQPDPFTTTSSFSPFGTSTASQAPTSPPPSSRNATASPIQTDYAPPSSPPPNRSSSLRPAQLSRAISQGTEHDDPILKMLTGMGYDRTKALKALEKYDYNIDMVSLSFILRHSR